MALFSVRSREIKLWRVVLLLAVACALLVGGALIYGFANEPRYIRLRSGMTPAEVLAIMGTPETMSAGKGSENWWYKGRDNIELYFSDGRLSGTDEKGVPAD